MAKYKELTSLNDFDMFDGTLNSIKENIFMRMFNKNNLPFDKSLDSVPHSLYTDLAITYSVEEKTYFNKQRGILCYMITNEDMETLNIDKNTIAEIASKNIVDKNSVRIESIQEHTIRGHALHPLTSLPEEAMAIIEYPGNNKNGTVFKGSSQLPIVNNVNGKKNVLLISNRTQTFAAVNYLFNDTLERLHEKFKENFYVIPMSVHELVCISESYASKNGELTQKETVEELKDMIEQVNDTLIENTADILSYNVYYHSYDDCCTMIVKNNY